MTEATCLTQNAEVTRNYIKHLLEQLSVDYKNTKRERKEIAAIPAASDEDFTSQPIKTTYRRKLIFRGWTTCAC